MAAAMTRVVAANRCHFEALLQAGDPGSQPLIVFIALSFYWD